MSFCEAISEWENNRVVSSENRISSSKEAVFTISFIYNIVVSDRAAMAVGRVADRKPAMVTYCDIPVVMETHKLRLKENNI